jgi:hypothetical protein
MDETCRKAWRELIDYFHSLPDEVSNWCFAPCTEAYVGSVAAYNAVVWPSAFVNLHMVRARLKGAYYASNAAVLDDWRRLLGNAIRFNHDPRAGAVEAGDAAAGGGGGAAPSFRATVFACVREFWTRLPLAGDGCLARALAREGGGGAAATPFWAAFAGAAPALAALEDFHARHHALTLPVYFRDGVYHAEDGFREPDDYLDFVPAPVFLGDVFERLLVGVFRAPARGAEDRMVSAWYGSVAEVAADVQRELARLRALLLVGGGGP